ncbi:hypothetical protein FJ930_23870 [Mesorhizobium sp. B2-4-15]|nr:hypothetical protein FJ930_23870 [Mesorhizobium sp. B2-4-15]
MGNARAEVRQRHIENCTKADPDYGAAPHSTCRSDRGGTFDSKGPSPSAIVRCVMTASRSFG